MILCALSCVSVCRHCLIRHLIARAGGANCAVSLNPAEAAEIDCNTDPCPQPLPAVNVAMPAPQQQPIANTKSGTDSSLIEKRNDHRARKANRARRSNSHAHAGRNGHRSALDLEV